MKLKKINKKIKSNLSQSGLTNQINDMSLKTE